MQHRKVLGQFLIVPNVNSAMNNLSTNLSVTGIENVPQSINIIAEKKKESVPQKY